MDFLEAVLDSAHGQHRDMVRWYGGPFDPIGLDEKRARFGMENMARRRRGPLASLCLPFISSGVHQERRPVRRHW